MIDFESSIVLPKNKNGFVTGVIVYINNKFFVKFKSVLYKIDNLNDLSNTEYLYSLPDNNKYPEWTKKSIVGKKHHLDKDIVFKYWCRFKPGLKIKGIITDDKTFVAI
jgi:hypothetical protein